MQQSSKTRTWANDEGVDVPSTSATTTNIGPDINPDGGLEESQLKKGNEMQIDDQAYRRSKPEDVNPSQIQPAANLTGNRDIRVEKDKLTESHPGELPSQSDADWLRSKTSRLLGLLDEKEEADQADMGDGNRNTSTKDESRDYQPEEILPDQHSMPDEVAMNTGNVDANSDLIRTTGRLFVRNLVYGASEADLEPLFSKFGKIEEVGKILSSLPLFLPPPLFFFF
jgi:multiple RNA-binding domain-containing protein 1